MGVGIAQKLNLIRRIGNPRHEGRPIQPQTALQVLRELFHVMVFAAFRYSTEPKSVPTSRKFDPSLAAKLAPLSRSELATLAAKFRAQSPFTDHGHADVIFPKDIDLIVDILHDVNRHALPSGAA